MHSGRTAAVTGDAGASVAVNRKAITLEFERDPKYQRVLKQMEKRLNNAKSVSVGILADAEYPKGYSNRKDHRISETRTTTSVAQVAFWNEFGAPKAHIPPRPFMRTTITECSPRWGETMAYLAKTYNYDALKMLTSMGEGIQGQIRLTIQGWSAPANAAFTVKIKGFNKPLTDEGIMKEKVDFVVLK